MVICMVTKEDNNNNIQNGKNFTFIQNNLFNKTPVVPNFLKLTVI